ncbi:MAG: adenosine-specific kinase [Candidatus Micrarchaeia archaeon]
MELKIVEVEIPSNANVIFGQAHFIKTVEDLYEALAESSPSLKFGFAFCEASGKRLVRSDGNDKELILHAEKEALKIGCGHSFIIFLRDGYPVNVLNRVKQVAEVVNIFAASANPIKVIIAEEKDGRGVLGVIDGQVPLGVEKEEDREWRHELLRKIGYKR